MLRAVFVVLGRPALLHAIALGVALGIPAAILFGSNGLRAVDVVRLVHHSLIARSLLWTAWLALSVPALRVLFDAPGTRILRALQPSRYALIGGLFLLGSAIELPWAILFAQGGGAASAWAALTLTIAFGSACIVAARRRSGFVLLALLSALIAVDPPARLAAICGTALVPVALSAAWRTALEQPGFRLRLLRRSSPVLALYSAHVLRLWRAARARLFVALTAGLGGGIGLIFSLENDPTERPLQRALSALALPLTLAAAACVAPVIESEARLRVLLRSCRVPRSVVMAAFLLAIASPSSALAAGTGVAASSAARVSPLLLSLTLLAWALALSLAVALWGRLLEARARRSAGAFAAGVTLIAALALCSVQSW
ncbi:MAG TPA: hypothetical protein VHV51_12430 [Polyangiaceae bacterium]|nr:hypothetical protein [Polyangiaceae bacterium]